MEIAIGVVVVWAIAIGLIMRARRAARPAGTTQPAPREDGPVKPR